MTTPLRTSQAGMHTAQVEFENMSSTMIGDLQTINNLMVTLQAAWGGRASSTYGQAMDRWEAAFKRVIDKLNVMIEVTGGSAKGYAEAEEAAYSKAGNWGEGIPGV
ncbi:MAG TPA: WXG100 family type VII secretion target [Actinoplanes sp.]|nr:WXG100 family type VII secretion target [Actinoplanes sp.]